MQTVTNIQGFCICCVGLFLSFQVMQMKEDLSDINVRIVPSINTKLDTAIASTKEIKPELREDGHKFLVLPKFENQSKWIESLEKLGFSVAYISGPTETQHIRISSPIFKSDLERDRWSERVEWNVWITPSGPVGLGTVFERPLFSEWRKKAEIALVFRPD